jgi:hypothetical protein
MHPSEKLEDFVPVCIAMSLGGYRKAEVTRKDYWKLAADQMVLNTMSQEYFTMHAWLDAQAKKIDEKTKGMKKSMRGFLAQQRRVKEQIANPLLVDLR